MMLNQPLKGAKFRVVRQANNQVIGEFESDENGNIAVSKLLKDKYILTEIEAPSGHIIKEADTVVNVEDFGAGSFSNENDCESKGRNNDYKRLQRRQRRQRRQTTTTTTTTNKSTTTQEPTTEPTTTTSTTTQEPTTTTTTTEEPTPTTTTTTPESTTTTTTTQEPNYNNDDSRANNYNNDDRRSKNHTSTTTTTTTTPEGQQRIRPNLVTQMILARQLQTEVARHSCQKQVKQSLLVSS